MSNPSKRKGTAWETAIRDYLLDEGFRVYRQPAHGTVDKGDLHIGDSIVVEAKNCQRHELAKWLDEANTEAANAGLDVGVVWAHRKGRSKPEDAFILMDGRTFTYLLRERGI